MKRNSVFNPSPSDWASHLLRNKLLTANMTAEEIYDVIRNEDSDIEEYMNSVEGEMFCFELLGSLEENGYSVKY